MRHYSDFFKVDDEYRPMMTREEINKTPDRWLDFYPHNDFETICKTLLSVLTSGAKSVWITGNLGTGKKRNQDDYARLYSYAKGTAGIAVSLSARVCGNVRA